MLDALRAMQVVPAFRAAIVVHLVEISPSLQQRQQQALAAVDVPVMWHQSFDEVPDGPAIILANELFDALPVNQAIKQFNGWYERVVEIDADGKLAFGIANDLIPLFDQLVPASLRDAPIGAIYEWRADNLPLSLGRRVVRQGGAALIVDYGHVESAPGETLQAVGGHAFVDPLESPGAVDLTAHVDFQAFAHGGRKHGRARDRADPPGRIPAQPRRREARRRAQALASPRKGRRDRPRDQAAVGEGRSEMGKLFKVMAVSDPKLGTLPGFEAGAVNGRRHAASAIALNELPGIRHGFFTRAGGVSDGVYESLNGGVGSDDAPAKVAENRARMAQSARRRAGAFPHLLPNPFADRWWWPIRRGRPADRPRADAIVTRTPGHRHRRLDRRLRTGAARRSAGAGGRRGSRRLARRAHRRDRGDGRGDGKLGAERSRIVAAAGPMIRQPSYEVGQDLIDRFDARGAGNTRFFEPAQRPGHAMFDLAGYRRSAIAAGRDRGDRGYRPVHLRRSGAVLFLSPRHPPGRARLRPPYQRHRAGRLTSPATWRPFIPTCPQPMDRDRITVTNSLRNSPSIKKWRRAAGVRRWVAWSSARLGRAAAYLSRCGLRVLAVAALAAAAAGCSSSPSDGRRSLGQASSVVGIDLWRSNRSTDRRRKCSASW